MRVVTNTTLGFTRDATVAKASLSSSSRARDPLDAGVLAGPDAELVTVAAVGVLA
jgi:hypothetical protein